MAIFGADQGRDRAGEKPGVDQAAGKQNRHTCYGQSRIAPCRDRRPIGITVPPRLGQEQNQRRKRPQPQARGEQMEDVRCQMQIPGRAGCRRTMAGPGEARQHHRGEEECHRPESSPPGLP